MTGKRTFPRRQSNATEQNNNRETSPIPCTYGNNCYDRDCTIHGKKNREHTQLSWTGCYDDNYLTHISEKDGAGWYPQKPKSRQKQLNTTSHEECITRSPKKLDYDDEIPDLVPNKDQQSEDNKLKIPKHRSPMF